MLSSDRNSDILTDSERRLWRNRRRAKRWTQQQLADEVGVSLAAIESYEQGLRNPRVKVRAKIRYRLGILEDYSEEATKRIRNEAAIDLMQKIEMNGLKRDDSEVDGIYEDAMKIFDIADRAAVQNALAESDEYSPDDFINVFKNGDDSNE